MMKHNTMKAVICAGYQSNDYLKVKDVPLPSNPNNNILIRVTYSSIESGDAVIKNADNFMIKLIFGLRRPRQPILGTGLVGIIEEVGSNVTNFSVGDRVISSRDMKFGCHAQYVSMNKNDVIEKIPDNLNEQDAISIMFGGFAALHYLKKHFKPGRMLIYGASGSVGLSMVQLAKHYGYHVTAVSSKKNHDWVRSFGDDIVVDYKKDGWKDQLTQYDIIFDAVGKTTKGSWKGYLNQGPFYTIAKGLVKANN